MLMTNKQVQINGSSTIEVNGETHQIAYFNATINDNSRTNVSVSIIDTELYSANKVGVRADLDNFYNEVYAVEDSMMAENVTEEVANENTENTL